MPSVQKIATHLTIMKEVSNVVAFKNSDAVFQVAEILRQAKNSAAVIFGLKRPWKQLKRPKKFRQSKVFFSLT